MKQFGVLMSAHTSMRVGGPAGVFMEPESEAELIELVRGCYDSDSPYFLLGNGSNVIVRDGGYPGAVISTLKALCGYSEKSKALSCGAGESLARACRVAAERGLSGMEELSGIPGTVGGAVFMNAGAYDREISDLVIFVRAYDLIDNNIITLSNMECGFGYRSSLFKTRPMVILSAEFELKPGVCEQIEARMAEYTRRRNEKQPVQLPSAGSFFKRPEGSHAGKLIEAAGMKGAEIGGARVSEKHAGFIVNTGGATAADVLLLADEVKKNVKEKFEIALEEEPVIIGVETLDTGSQ